MAGRSDRSELERLPADDYTPAGSNGEIQTKAEDIVGAVSPDRNATGVSISKQIRKV